MDVETVVKIEGYSVKYQEENDNGQAQSDEIESAVFNIPGPLLPGPCSFQNYDSTLPIPILFHPEIGSASNYKRKINADESPLTMTNNVNGGSSQEEEAFAEEKFKCSIPNCSKSFANKHKLNIHLKYEHRENWFKCHLCESAFPIEFVLKNHLATHSTAQPYVCNVCSKICENMDDLRKHEREHQITNNVIQTSGSEQQPLLQCSESAQIVMLKLTPISIFPAITPSFSLGATASRDVVLWSKSHTEKINELVNQETFPEEKCEKCLIPSCSKSFSNKSKLRIHLKNKHDQNRLFTCQFCGRLYLNKSELETHLVSHPTPSPHNCSVCSKSFDYIRDLRKHDQEVHQVTRSEKQLSFQRSVKKITPRKTPRPILPRTPLSFCVGAAPSQDVALCSESSTEKSELVNHELEPLGEPRNTKSVKKNRRNGEASAEEKFSCAIPNCSKSFSTIWKLKTHLINHLTARPHQSNVCSDSFEHIEDLRIHKQNVHQISLSSTEKRQLVNHERHEPDQLLKTQPQMLTTPTTLSSSYSTNEIEAEPVLVDMITPPETQLLKVNLTNKCQVCLKDFKSCNLLSKHISNVHTAEKKYKCHICPISCVNKSDMKIHLYFVHGEKSENLKIFKCEFCGREFPSVSRLEAHVVDKHVVDKEFECLVCSKLFVDQEALTKHQIKIHEQKIINYFCDVCSAGFTSRKNLGIHVKRVHEKLYCHKCVRSFESKSKFNQHSNLESTLNLNAGFKLQCQVCFVSLSTQCNFNIHIDGHLREKKSTLVT